MTRGCIRSDLFLGYAGQDRISFPRDTVQDETCPNLSMHGGKNLAPNTTISKVERGLR